MGFSNIVRLIANEKDSRASLEMTIRESDISQSLVTSHSAPLIPAFKLQCGSAALYKYFAPHHNLEPANLNPSTFSQFLLLFFQHGKAFYDAINDGLRTCGAAGDVDIDRDRLVHAAKHIIALAEDAAA